MLIDGWKEQVELKSQSQPNHYQKRKLKKVNSMAKGSRGGKRSSGATMSAGSASATQPTQQNQTSNAIQLDENDVLQGNVQAGNTSFDQFRALSDDDKADVIIKALGEDTPDFLEDSALQKLVYSTGMSDKPTLVDDATLDGMSGTEIFRTVRDTYDGANDVGYSAKEICDQTAMGDFTMYNANGGQAYGAGLYFATDYGHSAGAYGGQKSKTQTMRAKIKSTAKVISLSQATGYANREMNSGSKLGKALKQVARHDYNSVASIWAIAKGYDVLDCQTYYGYHTVINRGALVMSTTTKSPQSSGQWK